MNKPEPMAIEPEPMVQLKPTHPLPEHNCIRNINNNNNNNNNMMNEDDETTQDEEDEKKDSNNINNNNNTNNDNMMNEDEEQRAMDGIVSHDLGSTFAGEIFKRLRRSENQYEASYYHYTNELINKIYAPTIAKSIKTLMNDEENMIDHTIVTKWILNFMSTPISDGRYASKSIVTVIEGILVSKVLIQPKIICDYKPKEINIVKFTKSTSIETDGLYFIFIYICIEPIY